MYIQRALLLLILIVMIFLPAWISWTVEEPTAWYRPHLIWLAAIGMVYLGQRQTERDE